MNKQTTHVALILDSSGSMYRTKAATVQGYNEQVQQIKEDAQDENHDIFVSLVTFNGSVTEHLWDVPADQLEEASEKDFNPSGSTAMRDAMGHTIQKLLDTTDSNDEDTAYLVCVISDGEENSSKHFNASALKELTESVQNSDHWTINYMGCDESYLKQIAQETSVPLANCAVWDNNSREYAAKGMQEMGGKLGGYLKSRACGQTASRSFHNVSGEESCDNYVVGDDSPQIDPVVQPIDKQAIIAGLQNTLDITSSINETSKPSTNVFGVGNKVSPKTWDKYKTSRLPPNIDKV